MTRGDKMPGQTTLVLRFASDGQEFEVDVPATVTISPVIIHSRRVPFDDTDPIPHVIGHHTAVEVTMSEHIERILMENLTARFWWHQAMTGEPADDRAAE